MGEMQNRPELQDKHDPAHETTYQVGKTVFVVQSIFKDSGEETLGTVLLKLMRNEIDQN